MNQKKKEKKFISYLHFKFKQQNWLEFLVYKLNCIKIQSLAHLMVPERLPPPPILYEWKKNVSFQYFMIFFYNKQSLTLIFNFSNIKKKKWRKKKSSETPNCQKTNIIFLLEYKFLQDINFLSQHTF